MTGRAALGIALLLTLGMAARVSPGGEASLLGGAIVLALILVPQPPRGQGQRLRHDLRGLLPVLAIFLAAALALIELVQLSLEAEPGAGLAWFARVICLGAIAALPHTPPAGLVLHGLVVVLSLWTSSALHGPDGLGLVGLALGVSTIGLSAQGLILARSEELRRAAEASVTVGVAPSPWGRRTQRGPAAAVALITLLPAALGLSLPRLPRPGAASEPESTVASAPEGGGGAPAAVSPLTPPTASPSPTPSPGPRRVEFTPRLDLDRGRGEVLRSDLVVLRVRARPAPPVLLLRGAALTRATPRGWFPPQRELTPPPLDARRRWVMDLRIEQRRRQHDRLFAIGRPVRIEGVKAQLRRSALVTRGKVRYPLEYQVSCRYDPGLDGDWPRAYLRPELIALPPEIRRDFRLRALAGRIAVGRTAHLKAQQIARWLRATCAYDLRTERPSGLGLHRVLRRFLLDQRRGVCEEFAMAMACLLRIAGVPARVAIGYRAEERDASGAYLVRARDAHAWVEVAYQGAGWVTYDPTPPSVFSGDYQPPGGGRRRPRPTQTLRAPTRAPSPTPTATTPPPAPTPAPSATPAPTWRWPAWGTPLLALLICVSGGLTLLWGRRRLLHDVHATHLGRDRVAEDALLADRARLFALLAKQGFRLDGPETPLEFLARLRAAGRSRESLERAVDAYTRLRFSGRPDPEDRSLLRRCLGVLGW